MKRTITQFITLGVMLLLLVLIVSMYPEQRASQFLSQKQVSTSVSRVSLQAHTSNTRAD